MLNASVEKKNMKSIFFHTNRNIQQWQREITEHLLWQKVGYYCKNELIMIIAVGKQVVKVFL